MSQILDLVLYNIDFVQRGNTSVAIVLITNANDSREAMETDKDRSGTVGDGSTSTIENTETLLANAWI